jgi:hypothetical protein
MPSTFTTNTGIEKIADGEQTGLWGQTTNLNFDIVDRALNGAGAISLSGTTHTLTTSNGVLSDGQFGVLVFGGSPSGTNTVTISPNTAQKTYWVRNTTAQSVALTQGSGGNVTVPAGTVKAVYANGAGATAAVVDLTNVLSMGSPAITGGTINGAVIGGTTPAAGTFTTLTASSTATLNTLASSGATITGGTINGATIGASTASTGAFTTLSASTSLTTPLITNAGTLALSATGANVITASTNGAERLRITSAGNVGIGTTSPAESLHVNGTVRATGLNLNGTAVTATAAQINQLSNNTFSGAVSATGDGSSVAFYATAGLAIRQTGASGGSWFFDVAAGGATHGEFEWRSSNAFTTRMKIDANGNLGLGTTSTAFGRQVISFDNSAVSGTRYNHASGTYNGEVLVFLQADGLTKMGSVYCDGTSTSYNTSSDYRLKEDVQPVSDAVEKVMALRPVNYAWKANGQRVDGFLAHEAQAVVPSAVRGEKDAVDSKGNPIHQGMDHSKLIPLLTAALQDALTNIKALEARVAALETDA